MTISDELIKALVKRAPQLGLSNIDPVILSDAGNLIVHLSPYPIVARIAKLFDGDNSTFWKNVLLQELKVVEYLERHKVPVISLVKDVSPGPHKIDSTWMTLWEYIAPVELPPLESQEAISMLNVLSKALKSYEGPMQVLGAWKNVNQAAEYLTKREDKDERILVLLEEYEKVYKDIRRLELFPAHGDAHPNNLIPSSQGWKWIDFEDVSLMLKFWDLASFIGNTCLFQGLKHPTVTHVLNLEDVVADKSTFIFILKARVIMSVTTNLALALEGNGDLDFAFSQLHLFDSFITSIEDL
ncbi:hypothetical protein JOD43_003574 [Pullulanibacillus pueri]|uniref:Aminoglycoside phosphotransferase domain-containing protein n=1 Tax=Pullulanibacillus pueri TaxID=1437324 RepID=A0A8J2ZYS7_9BACL|nr:phosphotransferase [Pullulanibacillus pueri]MBM7683394.1 hypothetical protein [Pullulanibacillus pueri]GGH86497.1 hypothetical protein GCM10007096_34340 [Pullulanibacillus pueri]